MEARKVEGREGEAKEGIGWKRRQNEKPEGRGGKTEGRGHEKEGKQ